MMREACGCWRKVARDAPIGLRPADTHRGGAHRGDVHPRVEDVEPGDTLNLRQEIGRSGNVTSSACTERLGERSGECRHVAAWIEPAGFGGSPTTLADNSGGMEFVENQRCVRLMCDARQVGGRGNTPSTEKTPSEMIVLRPSVRDASTCLLKMGDVAGPINAGPALG